MIPFIPNNRKREKEKEVVFYVPPFSERAMHFTTDELFDDSMMSKII